MAAFDAIVLAGGTGHRLDGADKPGIRVAGRTLLDRALAAVQDADQVVVVGDRRATDASVRWVRESPPGGGPAAAVTAGLAHVSAARVVVLACDMPLVTAATVHRLVAALDDSPQAQAAVLVDDTGRRQPLAAAYDTAGLRAAAGALPGPASGISVRRLVAGLSTVEVAADGPEGLDCDTWADVQRSARLLREGDARP